MHSEGNRRRTLQKNDIAAAIARTDIYDFLVDTIPRDEMKEEGVGLPRAGQPVSADAYQYYHTQQAH
jgi:nuclear transcription factor Y gamma